jgi:hypothetical protein
MRVNSATFKEQAVPLMRSSVGRYSGSPGRDKRTGAATARQRGRVYVEPSTGYSNSTPSG